MQTSETINIKLTRWIPLKSSDEKCMVPNCLFQAEMKLVEVQENIEKRFQPVKDVKICYNCLNHVQSYSHEYILFRILKTQFERYVEKK